MREWFACLALLACLGIDANAQQVVRIKDLGRLENWRENALVGYGIVTGLSGSGDSPRNAVTQQTLSNVLGRLGLKIAPDDIASRNIAAVSISATLPPAARPGDRIDVTVSSIGDARSLTGGALLMTPLLGPDGKLYGLAQGPVAVGGFQFDSLLNREQRNYPASGVISGGATIETAVSASPASAAGLNFILRNHDVTTAVRVADAINAAFNRSIARVVDANVVAIDMTLADDAYYRFIAQFENLTVAPDDLSRVVVNERSGTVVAGRDVRIASVVIAQGDIRVSIVEESTASQPYAIGGINPGVESLIVRNTKMSVAPGADAVATFSNATVADLIEGLSALKVDTRGKISILQALKAAGALHADIVVQ